MNSDAIRVHLFGLIAAALLLGCGKPDQANIALRKENQALRQQIDDLNRRHDADAATIRALQRSSGTTVPTLPADRLDLLFTTTGLEVGRLTGPAPADPRNPGAVAIEVYAVPIDQAGQKLKAAGSFDVEAFDLAKSANNLVGRWHFTTEEARQNWYGQALLYTYVLRCPLLRPPEHPDLTLKVTFTDALTQRQFTVQKVIDVSSLLTSRPQEPSSAPQR